MKVFRFTILTFLLFSLFSPQCMALGWRGIEPLKSSRKDVEKKLKIRQRDDDLIATYHLKKEKVIVTYSVGLCESSGNSLWNVPKDTVLYIAIFPKTPMFLNDFSVDLSLFEKRSGDFDLPERFSYVNQKEGRSIDIDTKSGFEQDVVASYSFFPTADQMSLKCPSK